MIIKQIKVKNQNGLKEEKRKFDLKKQSILYKIIHMENNQ